mmetsp:Transcript_6377/g.18355  ORF Transcript_6377/g.18355 Transcript_6377/m.18355 type:complete len:433 (-) Transcript_6377:2475-3773(-)
MKLGLDSGPREPPSSPAGCVGDCHRLAVTLRRWGLGRMALDLALEVALVFTVLKVYNIVRNQFGSRVVPPSVAHAHALMVINFESNMGFFFEQRIQHYFLQWPDFVRFWNVFYWAAHSSNTIIALLALFFIRPLLYQRARSALLIMNCIAIIGYAAFPLMPPRLVPDCDTKYGGCDGHFTFVDTMDTLGGIWSWRGSALEGVSNHYAAMPSMHFGYALWVCTALVGLLRGGPFHPRAPWAQRVGVALVGLYPASVLFCILVTANHYILDAMCGGTVVGISYVLARHTPQFGRGAEKDWGAALHWVTGPNSSVVLATLDADGHSVPVDVEGLPLLPTSALVKARPGAPTSRGGVASLAGGGVAVVVARDEVVGYHSSPSNSDGGSPRSSAAPSLGGGSSVSSARLAGGGGRAVELQERIAPLRSHRQGGDKQC